jgi:hypothetical protein
MDGDCDSLNTLRVKASLELFRKEDIGELR